MPKNLVIVESPAKARTIERYLGADYNVLASFGHVRDLPENPARASSASTSTTTSRPSTSISSDRRSRSPTSRRRPRRADTVYLATDPDREGEAIAWHVAEAANVAGRQDPAA